MSAKTSHDDGEDVFASLAAWIRSHPGGYVHENLCLRGKGPERGVFAREAIQRGEKLIVLPVSACIGGHQVNASDNKNNDYLGSNRTRGDADVGRGVADRTSGDTDNNHGGEPLQRSVSPWLRCILQLYRVFEGQSNTGESNNSTSANKYAAYLASLPDHHATTDGYESLLQWNDDEACQYLAGTSLGQLLMADRAESSTASRYERTVRPYLKDNGIVLPSREKEFDAFQRWSMCVSTRGFHMTDSVGSIGSFTGPEPSYRGPFLLPMIDLLNHNPAKKSTTLRMERLGESNSSTPASLPFSFFMEAERLIDKGEEIFHSYGDHLTSAQLLQTFGFVPREVTLNAMRSNKVTPDTNATPCSMQKIQVVSVVKTLASSFPSIVSTIRKRLKPHKNKNENVTDDGSDDEDECWELSETFAHRDLSRISDDLLITIENPLSDELITLCCFLLLPDEAFSEVFPTDGRDDLSFLDKSVLDDRFLGHLVCETLTRTVQLKLAGYRPIQHLPKSLSCLATPSSLRSISDAELLQVAIEKTDAYGANDTNNSKFDQDEKDDVVGLKRLCAGLTIRLEEKRCLQALLDVIEHIQHCLESGISVLTPQSTLPVIPQEQSSVGKRKRGAS